MTAEGVVAFLVDMLKLEPTGNSAVVSGSTVAYYPAWVGKKTTLAAALTSLGITSTYAFRRKIAAANGIKGYKGLASENTQMYNLLVAGILKRT